MVYYHGQSNSAKMSLHAVKADHAKHKYTGAKKVNVEYSVTMTEDVQILTKCKNCNKRDWGIRNSC